MSKTVVKLSNIRASLRKGDRVTAIDGRERVPSQHITVSGGWNGKGFPYRLPNGVSGVLYPDSHVAESVTIERPDPKPRRRTIDGLTVQSQGERIWTTLDGRFEISYAEQGVTECENPHPMGRGQQPCPGGETHYYYGWQAWDTHALGGIGEYTFDIRGVDTFTEAVTMLTRGLSRERGFPS